MKYITINSKQFSYEIIEDIVENEYSSHSNFKTIFYQNKIKVPEWEFLCWKSKKTKLIPIILFSVNENIERIDISRDEMRNIVFKEYNKLIRKQEIERGEII